MSKRDRPTPVAPVDLAAFALVLMAALTLGLGLLSPDGSRLALVALVASIGGLLFLGLGVIRRSGTPPSVG